MGNQWCKIDNQTDTDFYVMTFNDADLIYTSYYRLLFYAVVSLRWHAMALNKRLNEEFVSN